MPDSANTAAALVRPTAPPLRRLVTPLATLLLILAAHGAAAQPEPELPPEAATIPLEAELGVFPPVLAGQFDNGLRYYILENREPENRAELRLVVRVGSLMEDEDQLGLAHFLEHMAFNGTERFEKQELVRFMESIGMRMGPGLNASTSFDETIYQLQVPTDNPEYLDTAFRIMEDWATALSLESEEIDLERGVVIEEWRQGQGAGSRVRDQQLPVLLQGSRYASRLPIGTLENLQTFDHESLRRFYREWYRPELMAVIAVGDFDAASIEQLVRQHFAGIPASPEGVTRPEYGVPPHEDTSYSIVTDPELSLTQVMLYHKRPSVRDWTVGGYRQSIVERLYNIMLNTRFQEITRQPNPPFLAAQSSNSTLVRPVEAYVLAAVVQEDGLERGLSGLLAESERVQRFGFNASELERQKTNMLRSAELAYNNRESRRSGALASELVRAFLTGESVPGPAWEYALVQRFLPEITLEEVNAVGRKWLHEDNRVVAVTAPQKDDLQLPDAATLAGIIADAGNSVVTAWDDSVSDEELVSVVPQGSPVISSRELAGGVTEWQLGNGVRVLLKPTNFRAEEVLFTALRKGGTSLADDARYHSANTAVTLVANGGVGNFNTIELQRKLTGRVASVSPGISEYTEMLNGNAAPADLETLFQLIWLRLTAPRADPDFFEVFREQTSAVLRNRTANPATVFEDAFLRLLYQDHPRRQPPSMAMLEAIKLDEAYDFYRERFGDASGFTFIFVGSFDPENLRPLAETWLGGLPVSGREANWRDVGVRKARGPLRETVRAGREPQARTRILFNGDIDVRDLSERSRLAALGQLLQIRLRDIMREQLGGTYGVQVAPQLVHEPVPGFSLLIEFGSDPARADELGAIVHDEVAALASRPATAAELEEIRQYLLRNYETRLQQNSYWISQLSQAISMGQTSSPADDLLALPAILAALNAEDIRAAAERLIDLQNYIHLGLLPQD